MSYTKNSSLQTSIFYTTITKNGANGTTTFTRPNFRFRLERVRTGDANPRWRELIKKHLNATTVLSGTYETIDVIPSSSSMDIQNAVGAKFHFEANGLLCAFRFLPTSDSHTNPVLGTTAARSLAMGKAYGQIREAQFSMSGGTFLGELREAIHMVRHPAEGLRKALQVNYLDKLKKIKKSSPDKWKKAISQTWLEGCFGWRPFVNDLEDALKAYEEIRDEKLGPRYKHIRAVGKTQQYVGGTTNSPWSPVSNMQHLDNGKTFDEAICVIRGEVAGSSTTTAVDKARVFGLTPSEFAPTAWELLPWSFLADYFTNIGDIISAAATDTSKVAWLEMSTIRKRVTEANTCIDVAACAALNGVNFRNASGSPSSLRYERKIVGRAPLLASDLRIPDLTFKLPGSPIKQLNMLALWTQANSLSPQDPRKLRGRIIR